MALRSGSTSHLVLGFSGYQWLVIAAAWAGWGFDIFDALLFNFVAPNCIPTLLQLPLGSAAAHAATLLWTGIVTSVLLLSWAAGGVLFGWLADRIGRKRALFVTIALYALGTALCALATNIGQLIAVPHDRRPWHRWRMGHRGGAGRRDRARGAAGRGRRDHADRLAARDRAGERRELPRRGVWFAADPHASWRYVFLAGLAPLLVAVLVRVFLRESAHWEASQARVLRPRPQQLFAPQLLRATVERRLRGGHRGAHLVGLQCVHPAAGRHAGRRACRARGPGAACRAAARRRLAGARLQRLQFRRAAGRTQRHTPRPPAQPPRPVRNVLRLLRPRPSDSPSGSAGRPQTRLALLFLVGAGVYGVFAVLTFYLPELFPARLRATGAGFCYNIGRLFAAAGPLVVGLVSAAAGGASGTLIGILFWVALAPLAAALLVPLLVVETRGRGLPP